MSPKTSTHLGWFAGGNLCRDTQGLQDVLLGNIVAWGLLDEVQQYFVTTCSHRQAVKLLVSYTHVTGRRGESTNPAKEPTQAPRTVSGVGAMKT